MNDRREVALAVLPELLHQHKGQSVGRVIDLVVEIADAFLEKTLIPADECGSFKQYLEINNMTEQQCFDVDVINSYYDSI